MKTRTTVALLLVLLFTLIAVAYGLQKLLLANILYLIPPLLAVLAGIYATRTFKISNSTGQVFALLTAGLACFYIGEILFFSYQFIFHIYPFPSIADVFYLLAYPLLFAGFLRAIFNHQVRWHNFSKLFLSLIVLLLLVLAVMVSYFGVYLAYQHGDSGLANFISIAYGVGDLIVIVPSLFVLKIVLDFRGGKLFNSWVLMLQALMLMLAGDLLYGIFRDQYNAQRWPYTLIDLTYVAMYLFFAFSFFYTASTVRELGLRFKK